VSLTGTHHSLDLNERTTMKKLLFILHVIVLVSLYSTASMADGDDYYERRNYGYEGRGGYGYEGRGGYGYEGHRHHEHHREREYYPQPNGYYYPPARPVYQPPAVIYYPPQPRYQGYRSVGSAQGMVGGVIGSVVGYEMGGGDPIATGLGAATGAFLGNEFSER
jgi:hypothetical protein